MSKKRSISGSVDSLSVTAVPEYNMVDSSTSVQSGISDDSLSVAMERFEHGRAIGREARVHRAVCNAITRSNEKEMRELLGKWTLAVNRSGGKSRQHTGVTGLLNASGVIIRNIIPPANLLRPPRGNLICSTKDLTRELLCIRRIPKHDRSSVAARLIRTLDPGCPSHSDIALAVYLIATL